MDRIPLRLLPGCVVIFSLYSGSVQPQERVNGTVGGSVSFSLDSLITDHPKVMIWKTENHNEMIAVMTPCSDPRCSPGYRERCGLFRNGTLRLENLTDKDTGNYIVTVFNLTAFTHRNGFYYLHVYSPASVVNGVLGGSAFFNAFEPNDTNLVKRWKFGDDLVAQFIPGETAECYNKFKERCRMYENGSLVLKEILQEDEGEYTLTVQRTERYQLRVYASLTAPVFRPDPQEIISGTNVTLHCEAGNQTVTSYTFYRGQKMICSEPHVTCRGSSLDFTPISKDDSGSYTCRIQNLISSSTSDPITVTVSWYSEGGILCTAKSISQAIQLGCSWSGGNPAANVTMIYDNRTESGQEQVSRNVSASDDIQGSKLTCNGHQLGRNSTCALLLEPPQSPDHEVNSKIQVTEGETVSLTLTLSSEARSRASSSLQIPQADFSWFLNFTHVQNDEKFQVTSSEESSRLHISKVSELDSGIYKCRAENVIGTTDFMFTLSITSRGLDIGAIVGIVLGILAALLIAGVGVIVYFILKGKQKKPKVLIYEQTDSSLSPIYENTAPGARIETTSPSKQEEIYEQIQYQDQSLYCNVIPGRRT